MAYRACYRCELVFDVGDGEQNATCSCPECGHPLEEYDREITEEPDDDFGISEPTEALITDGSVPGPPPPSSAHQRFSPFTGSADDSVNRSAARNHPPPEEMVGIGGTSRLEGLPAAVKREVARRGSDAPSSGSAFDSPLDNRKPSSSDDRPPRQDAGNALFAPTGRPLAPQAITLPTLPAQPPAQAKNRSMGVDGQAGRSSLAARSHAHADEEQPGRSTRILDLSVADDLSLDASSDSTSLLQGLAPTETLQPGVDFVVAPTEPGSRAQPTGDDDSIPGRGRFGEPREGARHDPLGEVDGALRPVARSANGSGSKRWLKIGLIVVGALGALGAAVTAIVWVVNGDVSKDPAPAAPAEPRVLSWSERLEQVLDESGIALPVVRGSKPLSESPYVAGGPDGLTTSMGPVPGLPSVLVPPPLVQSDKVGKWVGPLKSSLGRVAKGPKSLLLLAIDGSTRTEVVSQFAYSGHKAGIRRFGLVVGRQEENAKGHLPVTLKLPGSPLPANGAVVVRVGKLGFHVTVQSADGASVSKGDPIVPRRVGTHQLDMKGLGDRLVALARDFPSVSYVVLYARSDLPVDTLAALISRIRTSAIERFEGVALAL